MKTDHIGYAVKKIDRAIASFEKLGYEFGPVIDDEARNVKLAFGEKDGYRVELVCPSDKTKPSPVDSYLGKIGPTPYHICYQTEDLDRKTEELKGQGFRVVIEPEAAVAFGGRRVVFMMDLGLGLIEIVETDAPRK